MALYLIGIGLWDSRDISLKGLEALKQCKQAFAEQYTSRQDPGILKGLEELSGKKIMLLNRELVEGEATLLKAAEKNDAALLIPGDPLISTTHYSLIQTAKKKGIRVQVIHGASILSAAVGESGLHSYKFGNSVTLPFWRENYKPTSTYEVILENKKRGLHTLVFLDIDAEKGLMQPKQALEMLLEMEKQKKKKAIQPSDLAVVLSRIGSPEQKITAGKIEELLNKSLGPTPSIIAIPGKLHFTEEEALEQLG